jgi:putative tryptophan/tyrosine transport system substrate-binding protein
MTRPLAAAALLFAAAALAQARPRVVVVKSSDLAAYSSVVAGFSAEARAQIDEVTLEENADSQGKAFKKIAADKPALVLAIGPAAANGAKRSLADVPILFCMVPYFEKYALEGPNVTGIALTSDFGVELSTIKAALPAARRIGVLEDPRYSAKLIEDVSRVAAARELSVVPVELDAAAKVEKALKGAHGKVDAMLMIADKTVGNAAVVKRLIAWCDEEKVPLIALSASQVKEGALLSLSPSYAGVGQQAGRLANRLIVEKVDPGALAVAQPETLDLAVNLTTAKHIGSSCDLTLDLFRFAAKQGYPVKVFE